MNAGEDIVKMYEYSCESLDSLNAAMAENKRRLKVEKKQT